MLAMFNECYELEYLDLSNFDTSFVKDMTCMFCQCHKLKEIKGIDKFNTSNLIEIYGMFQGCKKIESLDLSNFNTSKMIFLFCLISVTN